MIHGEPQWRGEISLPEGPEWDILREMLQGLLHRAYRVEVVVRGDRARIRGKVFSEEVGTSIRNLVALYAPTSGVESELTWESPLYSADASDSEQEHDWGSAPTMAPPGSVDRHPYIKLLEPPVTGRRLDIMVDLTVELGAYTAGEFSLQMDSAWSRLDIDVVIDPDGIAIPDDGRRRTVSLNADGSSSPVLFRGIVGDVDQIVVRLYFVYAGSDCGYAETTAAVVPSSRSAEKNPPKVVNYMSARPDRPPASLTIRIRNSAHDKKWHWSFDVSPDLRAKVNADEFATTELDDTAKAYFERQFAECPALQPGRHLQKMRGIGERIWGAAPQKLHELYASIREIEGPGFPIQLITDEPYVPWELMFPEHSRVANPTHLFMEHPIARSFTGTGKRTLEFPRGRRISVVPTYLCDDQLPATISESEWLVTTLGAEKWQATYQAFDDLLRLPQSPAIQLVHFAGHGAAEGQGDHGLWLPPDGWMQVEEMNGAVVLGRDHHPFFALNACQVGQSSASLGAVAGWPMALASRGFGGVMAPLWSIEDNEASLFVQAFIKAFLIDGKTLGESALTARTQYASLSANAHAYLFYGDVMARAEP